ncbi:MAG: hypothetical protein G01um101425_520 [Candidatus Peregrinibacteria bacterium Gr01-1014_25]|nr:MAG: hypothetical protein G01um101425_520 [Candidatus Peregrinibacteria bacterium Gr01-1014_25]
MTLQPLTVGYFDDTTFQIARDRDDVNMIGGVFSSDEAAVARKEQELRSRLGLPEGVEIKWNLDSSIRERIGADAYNEYKSDFLGIVIEHFLGYIGVSQESKNDALLLLLRQQKLRKRCRYVFDEDLIEDPQCLQKMCRKVPWTFANSSSSIGLQAADYFVGSIKLLVQQNSGIHGRSFLLETPGYGPGRVPAEFMLRMQNRWMLDGPVTLDEDGLPWMQCMNHSVFISPNTDSTIQDAFDSLFGKYYMGCFH